MTKKERYLKVIEWFSENMPSPTTELHYDTPFHLLLAVILSAQCTDKRVNMVTPALFEAFPNPETLAGASEEDVYSFIKSVTFPNNKTRHLIKAAKILKEDFNGEMPSDIEGLMKLPGVGRKTANVMLAVVWNKAAMAVDTHVFRVSNRIGLTDNSKTPLATEKTLVRYFPEDIIATAHHWLILHGRYVCKARTPDCENCGLTHTCKHFNKIKTKNSVKVSKPEKSVKRVVKSKNSQKSAKKMSSDSKTKNKS
ncbi:MAG: endonuclease III [Muribaculaceae bacterium]|nr:endonuclease III [Muribaculaceae bacterium]